MLCGLSANNFYLMDGNRRLVRCPGCGLIFVSPQPSKEELASLYEEAYYRGGSREGVGYQDYLSLSKHLLDIGRYHLDLIERFEPRPGRILDVGCATGEFLQVAMERGWEVEGVELSRFSSQIARDRGLCVKTGTLHDVQAIVPYDVITIWDVLEHTCNPYAELKKTFTLLKPGGLLAMGVPNGGSLRARLEGRRWWAFYSSREHLFFFTPTTLSWLLARAGFRPVRWVSLCIDIDISYFLRNLFKGRWGSLFNPNPPINNTPMYSWPWGPVKWLLERLGFGHVLLVFARRS